MILNTVRKHSQSGKPLNDSLHYKITPYAINEWEEWKIINELVQAVVDGYKKAYKRSNKNTMDIVEVIALTCFKTKHACALNKNKLVADKTIKKVANNLGELYSNIFIHKSGFARAGDTARPSVLDLRVHSRSIREHCKLAKEKGIDFNIESYDPLYYERIIREEEERNWRM